MIQYWRIIMDSNSHRLVILAYFSKKYIGPSTFAHSCGYKLEKGCPLPLSSANKATFIFFVAKKGLLFAIFVCYRQRDLFSRNTISYLRRIIRQFFVFEVTSLVKGQRNSTSPLPEGQYRSVALKKKRNTQYWAFFWCSFFMKNI